jgi:hypothetical protein
MNIAPSLPLLSLIVARMVALARGQVLVAGAERRELLREAFEAVAFLVDVRVGELVLELAFDDAGRRRRCRR